MQEENTVSQLPILNNRYRRWYVKSAYHLLYLFYLFLHLSLFDAYHSSNGGFHAIMKPPLDSLYHISNLFRQMLTGSLRDLPCHHHSFRHHSYLHRSFRHHSCRHRSFRRHSSYHRSSCRRPSFDSEWCQPLFHLR